MAQAIAPRAKDRILDEEEKTEGLDQTDHDLLPSLLRKEGRDILKPEEQRHQDGHHDEEAEEELLAGAGVFDGIAVELDVGPEIASQARARPKAVDTQGHQRQQAVDQRDAKHGAGATAVNDMVMVRHPRQRARDTPTRLPARRAFKAGIGHSCPFPQQHPKCRGIPRAPT